MATAGYQNPHRIVSSSGRVRCHSPGSMQEVEDGEEV